MNMEDAEVKMLAVQAATDPAAFARLEPIIRDTISSIASTYYLPGEQHCDLVQCGTLAVWISLKNYVPSLSRFQAWVNVVVRRELRDIWQKRTRYKRKCMRNAISLEDHDERFYIQSDVLSPVYRCMIKEAVETEHPEYLDQAEKETGLQDWQLQRPVVNLTSGKKFTSLLSAAREFEVDPVTIVNSCLRKWKCAKCKWHWGTVEKTHRGHSPW